jgi:hypothetical protein
MTQGIAQQTGRQMGMTAAPPAPALNLVSDSEPPAEYLAEYFILPLPPPPIDIECDCC